MVRRCSSIHETFSNYKRECVELCVLQNTLYKKAVYELRDS
uniref:Uncharacterized protein n=1 Tax=Chlorella vulgaris TaxID=3077 RepID=V9H0R5_CHLVU|nr:hypothetical protein ChvulCp008 [Chlorella vulgaris]pir/T07196/ hypothetical protein 40a - Chlorella vulgaris chloroplast [Chlorella vulgaris]QSV10818.1 hypothetical protein [Chlorella vulgaris]BAA57843.1 unnamed protein product [Chlorella vulgaris]